MSIYNRHTTDTMMTVTTVRAMSENRPITTTSLNIDRCRNLSAAPL